MTYWNSNGHVTDDVTWPRKVKVIIPIYSGPIISMTVGDTDLMPMEHLQEMATWESNGHVTDDVTWPRKVKVVTPTSFGQISKMAGDRDLVPVEHQ